MQLIIGDEEPGIADEALPHTFSARARPLYGFAEQRTGVGGSPHSIPHSKDLISLRASRVRKFRKNLNLAEAALRDIAHGNA